MICAVSALLKLHTLEAAWHVKKKKYHQALSISNWIN